jgi:hypothetical protein
MTIASIVNPLEQFRWMPQPAAEALVREIVDLFLAHCLSAARLRDRMRDDTGTRFSDWIDSIHLPDRPEWRERLTRAGFVSEGEHSRAFAQPAGIFPRLVLHEGSATKVFVKVESVADFAAAGLAWGLPCEPIEGDPLSPMRRVRVGSGRAIELWAIERHGYRGFTLPATDDHRGILAARQLESFRTRRRNFDDDVEGFMHARRLIDAAEDQLGIDLACDLFFAAEREFWQRRNRAAQFQKARQDRLGLGWANHDHHTYRSSRKHFARLIGVLEKLGFVCRERFYAGAEAGWGAQVLEQPHAGIVVFADVDLSPDELFNDFAHEELPPREQLGTVGLWCGLHGEAFLQAGMHHLECQFDFEALKQQMEQTGGIKVMKPFTDFPYLKQAFTEGERWPVDERRIESLLAEKKITPQQADQFRAQGAIGSHLENLERNEGFKGFNQNGVSEIIAHTDPRRHLTPARSS